MILVITDGRVKYKIKELMYESYDPILYNDWYYISFNYPGYVGNLSKYDLRLSCETVL